MIAKEAEEELGMMSYERLRAARMELGKVNLRSRAKSETTFNLNSFSDEEANRQFWFRLRDIGKIVEFCGWTAVRTKRCRYIIDPVTAVCHKIR